MEKAHNIPNLINTKFNMHVLLSSGCVTTIYNVILEDSSLQQFSLFSSSMQKITW